MSSIVTTPPYSNKYGSIANAVNAISKLAIYKKRRDEEAARAAAKSSSGGGGRRRSGRSSNTFVPMSNDRYARSIGARNRYARGTIDDPYQNIVLGAVPDTQLVGLGSTDVSDIPEYFTPDDMNQIIADTATGQSKTVLGNEYKIAQIMSVIGEEQREIVNSNLTNQEKEIKLDILQQTKDGLINKRNSEAREQLRKEKAAIKEQELLREIAFHENVAYGDAQFPIEIRAPYEKDLGSIRDVAAGPDYRGPTSAEQDKSREYLRRSGLVSEYDKSPLKALGLDDPGIADIVSGRRDWAKSLMEDSDYTRSNVNSLGELFAPKFKAKFSEEEDVNKREALDMANLAAIAAEQIFNNMSIPLPDGTRSIDLYNQILNQRDLYSKDGSVMGVNINNYEPINSVDEIIENWQQKNLSREDIFILRNPDLMEHRKQQILQQVPGATEKQIRETLLDYARSELRKNELKTQQQNQKSTKALRRSNLYKVE